MRGPRKISRWLTVTAGIALTIQAGCSGTARRTTGSSASSSGEPVLSSEVVVPGSSVASSSASSGAGSNVTIVEPGSSSASAGASQPVAVVDRHPLFRKPQEYYENSKSNNKLVKTAAATFVGVPAGILGEFRQIVVGKPSSATY